MSDTDQGVLAKILFLDDSPLLRTAISQSLELEGFEVLCASQIEEAEVILKEHQFDVMIVDCNLGTENGLELIVDWRQKETANSELNPAFIIAIGGSYNKEEAYQAGASSWLDKPFTPDELEALIRENLQ